MDKKDVVDDLAELAELSNTDVEVISTETEEGQMLKNALAASQQCSDSNNKA